MKPVHVQPITVSRMVGFNNNLAQMIIMTRLCDANKNRIARSKVRDRVCSLTLNIGFSETCCVQLTTLSCMVGSGKKCTNNHYDKTMCCEQELCC